MGNELRPMTKENDVPLFANTYGFLMINQESVHTLNKSLKELQVDHKRFRPNIVVKGKLYVFTYFCEYTYSRDSNKRVCTAIYFLTMCWPTWSYCSPTRLLILDLRYIFSTKIMKFDI